MSYPVIAVCGSKKYIEQMNEVSKELTMKENIVIPLEFIANSDEKKEEQTCFQDVILLLQDINRRKIDFSDEVFIVNPDGYIDDFTWSDICYTNMVGKKIRSLVPIETDEIENKTKEQVFLAWKLAWVQWDWIVHQGIYFDESSTVSFMYGKKKIYNPWQIGDEVFAPELTYENYIHNVEIINPFEKYGTEIVANFVEKIISFVDTAILDELKFDNKSNKLNKYNDLSYRINNFDLSECNAKCKIELETFDKCDEANLWCYFEGGREHLDAKILIVGQDWGTLDYKDETIVNALNSGEYRKDTYCYMDGNNNPTNLTLCELVKEMNPKYDLLHDKNTYKELFFTNFVPWYRKKGSSLSGYENAWTEYAAPLFKELVEIIQPEIIICLGQKVFNAVIELSDYKGKISGKNYNEIIVKGVVNTTISGINLKIYPMAHCGYYGSYNRNEKQLPQNGDILFNQRKDWKKID